METFWFSKAQEVSGTKICRFSFLGFAWGKYYLEKGKSITGEYYSSLIISLTTLRQKIVETSKKFYKGVLFLRDNAPAHKSHIAINTIIHDVEFKTLDHPLYFPDLAPSDYYVSSIKKKLKRPYIFHII